jgi:hypothetical protein
VKQTAKKNIIERLVEVPPNGKRPFWAKEMTLLKRLLEAYPDLIFWTKVRFREKFPSLAFLLTDIGKAQVKRKYNEFTFEVPNVKQYNLGDKVGEDKVINRKHKTIRSFLRE